MRQTSEIYKQLRSQTGSYYEVKIVRGLTEYGMDRLKKVHIMPALFKGNGPQIGRANSTQCEIKLLEESDNWPRMASFDVLIRLSSEDGTEKSEWLNMGRYYTDERHADKYGNLEIIAFDGMLLLEQPWTDKVETLPSQWPITASAACALLSEATGIQIDSRSVLDDTVPFIGLNTTSTAREVFATIAAGLGGNWYMTSENKLRLINLSVYNMEDNSDDVGRSVARIEIGEQSSIDRFVPSGSSGLVTSDGATFLSIGESVGNIVGVELETDSGTIARTGQTSGYILKAKCNFSDSAIADLCLSRVLNYVYNPFTATGVRIDPAAEVGDIVVIDGEEFPIISINWNIAKHITAKIEAPFEEEVDHEYTMLSESAKTLRKSIGYTDGQIEQTRSYIEQTERAITQGVAATYVSNTALAAELNNYSPTAAIENNYYSKTESDEQADALASEIELTDSRLTLAFSQLRADTNDAINAMSYYIRYENGVVIVGKTDSRTSIRISNEQIALYYGDEMLSYWNQNKQYTPKELQIPTGGKFTLGNILFQPRTSGNMSLLWVR